MESQPEGRQLNYGCAHMGNKKERPIQGHMKKNTDQFNVQFGNISANGTSIAD